MSSADFFQPLPQDTRELFGLRSASEGGVLFCGVTQEAFAINGVTHQWPRGITLRWHIGFSRLGPLGDMDLKQTREANLAEISAACNLKFEYTSNHRTAHLMGVARRLDGRMGILAQHGIPVGANGDTQLLGEHDDAEQWGIFTDIPPAGFINWQPVDLHELLHAVGLGHGQVMPSDPALIQPAYDPRVRHLQRRDIAELVRRYGKPIGQPPPPSTPALGDSLGLELIINGPHGESWKAKGTAKRVA